MSETTAPRERAAPKKRRRRITEREREALEWMPDILNMVRERLALYLGEESMRGTPPMFYDDAIRSVAHRAAFGKLPEEMYPEGSLLHRLRTAEQQRDALLALAKRSLEYAGRTSGGDADEQVSLYADLEGAIAAAQSETPERTREDQ